MANPLSDDYRKLYPFISFLPSFEYSGIDCCLFRSIELKIEGFTSQHHQSLSLTIQLTLPFTMLESIILLQNKLMFLLGENLGARNYKEWLKEVRTIRIRDGDPNEPGTLNWEKLRLLKSYPPQSTYLSPSLGSVYVPIVFWYQVLFLVTGTWRVLAKDLSTDFCTEEKNRVIYFEVPPKEPNLDTTSGADKLRNKLKSYFQNGVSGAAKLATKLLEKFHL